MNRDFVEMLAALTAAGVEFLIVDAYAMAAHGQVHLTTYSRPNPPAPCA